MLWSQFTPSQIQYGGFQRALMKKSGDMIRDQVRILCLIFLWSLLITNYVIMLVTAFKMAVYLESVNFVHYFFPFFR